MITCEKCGEIFNREEITTFQVSLKPKKKSQPPEQRPLDLCKETCAHLWDEIAPGNWVSIGGEEVRRLYWSCDHCGEVYRFDAVKLMVQLVQTPPPPRTEWIICEECEKCEKKNTQDGNQEQWIQWTPELAAQAGPGPEAQEQEEAATPSPAGEEPGPASQEEAQAATSPHQSGWQVAIQTVQVMVETVMATATETYRKIIKE